MSEDLERNTSEPEEAEDAIGRKADDAGADEDFEAHRLTDGKNTDKYTDRNTE
jgi:hypothetical protein